MANKIVFNYNVMDATVTKINNIATQYEQAADTFKTSMQNATSAWTGVSKDKFTTLVETSPTSIFNYMHNSVPEMVRGIAALLKNNIEAMSGADGEIAKNIPDGI